MSVDQEPWWAGDRGPDESDRPVWWPPEYAQAHPYWHVWQGVAGLLYGRRLLSSPPRVVRATEPDELKRRIEAEGV